MNVSQVWAICPHHNKQKGMTEYIYNIVDCNTFIVLMEYAFVLSNDMGKHMSMEDKIKALQAKAEIRYKESHKGGNIAAVLRCMREL